MSFQLASKAYGIKTESRGNKNPTLQVVVSHAVYNLNALDFAPLKMW